MHSNKGIFNNFLKTMILDPKAGESEQSRSLHSIQNTVQKAYKNEKQT